MTEIIEKVIKYQLHCRFNSVLSKINKQGEIKCDEHIPKNIIIIIIKKDWQCKAGRGRLTPYQSEDPSPSLPAYRGKEDKEKTVEGKKGESNQANKKALDLLFKPANPTPSNTGSTRLFQRDTES